LSQATLSEVLDTLAAMRGGTPLPAPPAVLPKPVPQPAKLVSAPASRPAERSVPAKVESRAEQPESAEKPAAPAPAAKPAIAGPALIAETPPPVEPAPELDLAALWSSVIARVRKDRPLVANCVEAATLLEIVHGTAVIGFPPDRTFDLEQLDMPNQRRFIEALLSELAGRALVVKCVKREGLVVAAPPRAPEPAAPPDPMDEFKNDPLIRKALELFRAEIQPA
jgi:hypothetical protein